MSDEAWAGIVFIAMGFVHYLPGMLYAAYKKLKGESNELESDSTEA